MGHVARLGVIFCDLSRAEALPAPRGAPGHFRGAKLSPFGASSSGARPRLSAIVTPCAPRVAGRHGHPLGAPAPRAHARAPPRASLNLPSPTSPRRRCDIGRAHTDVRHDLPDTASAFCCFSADWDPAYEFTAPRSNAWYMRPARALGISGRSHEGTMFDVVDELQRCEHISRLQSRQLYALVRAAMALLLRRREAHPETQSSRHPRGALRRRRPRRVRRQLAAPQTYWIMSPSSPSRTPSRSSPPCGDATRRKRPQCALDAEKIKAHIYRYESLAGEYADPPDYQVQYPVADASPLRIPTRRRLSRRRARRYRRQSRRRRGALGILVGVGRTYAGMVGR